jgi:uncharacterized protein (DUF2062 family)
VRKHFKRFLPSHEAIRQNRFIGLFGSALHHHNLWHLHRRSVAGGVAVGLFAAMIPGPVQMLGAALLSSLFKVNLPVAVLATMISNPFTIVPMYYCAYKIGELLTGQSSNELLKTLNLTQTGLTNWFPAFVEWMSSLGKPLAVGLPIFGALLAVGGYFAARGVWRLYVVLAWRRRQRLRADRNA